MIRNSLLLLFLWVICISCYVATFEAESQMRAYLQDEECNGYKYTKIVNGLKYTIEYQPTDLLVQQELPPADKTELLEKLRSKYKKYIYFNLTCPVAEGRF